VTRFHPKLDIFSSEDGGGMFLQKTFVSVQVRTSLQHRSTSTRERRSVPFTGHYVSLPQARDVTAVWRQINGSYSHSDWVPELLQTNLQAVETAANGKLATQLDYVPISKLYARLLLVAMTFTATGARPDMWHRHHSPNWLRSFAFLSKYLDNLNWRKQTNINLNKTWNWN
jgi:hypothetical protein